jgi:hypothetical protein
MRDGAAIGDKRRNGAAVGGVSRDALWPVAEPIIGPCQHGPPRIDFRREAGGLASTSIVTPPGVSIRIFRA